MATLEDRENETSKVPYSRMSDGVQEHPIIDNIFISRYDEDWMKWKNTNNLMGELFRRRSTLSAKNTVTALYRENIMIYMS
jgi:hypothetical protein